MSKHTNLILGITAIIGISAGSPAFADTIQSALESNRDINREVTRVISGRSSSTPWTINDYVKANRATVDARESGKSQKIAAVMDTSSGSWQAALGNPPKL